MNGKHKLSIFVHKNITREQRQTAGFAAAMLFLPRLYVAHLIPTPTQWDGSQTLNSRPMDDEHLHTPSEYFDYVHEGFEAANRAEIHILASGSKDVAIEVEFYKGKESTGHKLVFAVNADGHFDAGFHGGDRIR